MPALDPQAKMWMDMITPLKSMAEGMNQGHHIPALDTLNTITKQLAIIYSLFYSEYDGGDFCKGLIFSKEMATIFWGFGKNIFSGMFETTDDHKAV